VLLMAGERGVSPERYAELTAQLGYDKPIWQQYFDLSGRLFHGDLGNSLVTKKPVLTEFLTLFPATVELGLVRHHHRHADRRAGRRAGRDQARLVVRPDLDDHRAGRLFDADLLVGPAADHPSFRHPWLDAGVGPHLADVFLPPSPASC
jgi:hypothetical protein